MRKLWVAIVLLGFFSIPLKAQDYPRVEIYGGYQLVLDSDFWNYNWNFDKGTYLHGFTAAGEVNVRSWFGIVGEVGHGRTSFSDYGADYGRNQTTLLAGPRFGYRGGRVRIFGHALFGFNREMYRYEYPGYIPYKTDLTSFSSALGGGMDVSLGRWISIRPFQFDLLSTYYGEKYGNDYRHRLRYTAGLLVKLGSVAR
jgi:hypothetical protein